MPESGKLFQCVLCSEKFSTGDVVKGFYFASTGVCRGCYEKGQKTENSIWCFGSFSVEYLECRLDCPDRKICKVFTKNQKESVGNAEGNVR